MIVIFYSLTGAACYIFFLYSPHKFHVKIINTVGMAKITMKLSQISAVAFEMKIYMYSDPKQSWFEKTETW